MQTGEEACSYILFITPSDSNLSRGDFTSSGQASRCTRPRPRPTQATEIGHGRRAKQHEPGFVNCVREWVKPLCCRYTRRRWSRRGAGVQTPHCWR